MWRLHQSIVPVWIQVSLQRKVALISEYKYKYDDTHLLPFSIKQHCSVWVLGMSIGMH